MTQTKPWFCRMGLHRYRFEDRVKPPWSIPARDGIPANPFTVARTLRICQRCGQLDPTYARMYPDEAERTA